MTFSVGSIGLGIQSTAMALMAIHDILPRPDAFIFADTKWERQGTYENLHKLKPLAEKAGIPFYVVNNGNIRADALDPTRSSPSLPYYIKGGRIITVREQYENLIKSFEKKAKNPDLFHTLDFDAKKAEIKTFMKGVRDGHITDYFHKGKEGMMMRQCTYDYKIVPSVKLIRKLCNPTSKNPATFWIGFSIDEIQRMSPSKIKSIKYQYPLIEHRISRQGCVNFLEKIGYPIPCRSSCIGCPFHDDHEWRNLNLFERLEVEDFESRVNKIGLKRKNKENLAVGRIRLHRSTKTIDTQPYLKDDAQSELDLKSETCGGSCFT